MFKQTSTNSRKAAKKESDNPDQCGPIFEEVMVTAKAKGLEEWMAEDGVVKEDEEAQMRK